MRFVIVTGMSGAGKSTVLRELEDENYYCVDNLPAELVGAFARIASSGTANEFSDIAVGIDIRGSRHPEAFEKILGDLKVSRIHYEILFLDADDEVLLNRFKETRRIHPLAGKAGSVTDGILRERDILKPMRDAADHIIDTTMLYAHELKDEIRRVFETDNDYGKLFIRVMSFGFKYGLPPDADLVADIRFIPNPYYQERLRNLTGLDDDVRKYVMNFPQSQEFIDSYGELLCFLLPHYITEGKTQLVIAVGCTGGRHRSVVMAEALGKKLSYDGRFLLRIEHRDIDKDLSRKRDDYGK